VEPGRLRDQTDDHRLPPGGDRGRPPADAAVQGDPADDQDHRGGHRHGRRHRRRHPRRSRGGDRRLRRRRPGRCGDRWRGRGDRGRIRPGLHRGGCRRHLLRADRGVGAQPRQPLLPPHRRRDPGQCAEFPAGPDQLPGAALHRGTGGRRHGLDQLSLGRNPADRDPVVRCGQDRRDAPAGRP